MGWNAVIRSIGLVGAVRRVFAARERGYIDIPAGDILDRKKGGFATGQCIARVGDNLFADRDHDAGWVRTDLHRVVGPRNRLRRACHDLNPSQSETGFSRLGNSSHQPHAMRMTPVIARPRPSIRQRWSQFSQPKDQATALGRLDTDSYQRFSAA